MVSISIPEKEKERIWKDFDSDLKSNFSVDYNNEQKDYQFFSLILDGIAKNMTQFHYENWRRGKTDYVVSISDVANYVTQKGFEIGLWGNFYEISEKIYFIVYHFVKVTIYQLKYQIFNHIFTVGKTIKANKDDETDEYNIQSMSGIAISDSSIQYELKEFEENTKVKRGAWKREVIEDIQSLGLKQPRMVKGTVFVTCDYIDEEAIEEEASTNNILNVDIYNYETVASPTYETEHFEEKLTNAEQTARDFFKNILE
jgi:hypothetical protein